MPKGTPYDGTADPADHIALYSSWARNHGYSDAVKCRLFDATLIGEARKWWDKLPTGSIHTWAELRQMFATQFVASRTQPKNPVTLAQTRQREGETLQSWMKRFTKAKLEVGHLSDDALLLAASAAMRPDTKFAWSINKKPPRDFCDFLARARNYMNAESESTRGGQAPKGARADPAGSQSKKDKKRPAEAAPKSEVGGPEQKKHREGRPDRQGKGPRRPRFEHYHELVGSVEEVYVSSRDEVAYPAPKPLKGKPAEKHKDKFCLYHNAHGHTTATCFDLKDEIEALIRQGHLKKYRKDQEANDGHAGNRIEGEIHVITGGPHPGGDSRRSQKGYAREVRRKTVGSVFQLEKAVGERVEFTDADAEGVAFPHHDPLIITAMIGNHLVHRCLIDCGSSADILYLDAFEKMNISSARLRRSKGQLSGFTGNAIAPEGMIDLPVTVGEDPCKASAMATFMVVRGSSSYNAIIGRPTLVRWKAVVSAYHMCMKFPTPHGVGTVRGNQERARTCYNASLRPAGEKTAAKPRTEARSAEIGEASSAKADLDPRLPVS